MKITCKSCGQPIEVEDGADITGVQCPSCGAVLSAPVLGSTSSWTQKYRNFVSHRFTTISAVAALVLALYCTYRIQTLPSYRIEIAAADPITTAKNYYRSSHANDYWSASGAFWRAHASEISKTLEIASTNGQGDYMLALVRFSVGDKVFRDGLWLKRFDGKWYVVPFVSTYKPEADIAEHLEWFEKANEKRDAWEKESASGAK